MPNDITAVRSADPAPDEYGERLTVCFASMAWVAAVLAVVKTGAAVSCSWPTS